MSTLDDPRVYFAAERTALAWNRTALTLMAFGLAIARFGLFDDALTDKAKAAETSAFWFGLVFVLMGCLFSATAAKQYKKILKTLKPNEIPAHVNPRLAYWVNAAIALLAAALAAYLAALQFG